MQHAKDWVLGLIFGTALFLGIVFTPDYSADTQPAITPQVQTR
ncbi:hypothetical protein QP976_00950 [Corynebacterium striatum]|nr:hypothetical protein [Corynebacterium striatum]MDK8811565.1 hypothetical protein [Corynebacterium striatum]